VTDTQTKPKPAATGAPPKLATVHSTREIEALIPHRWPILLVDRIVEYDAEQPGFGDRIGLFAGIDDCRFKRVVVPGDVLRLEITMDKLGSRFGRARGVASVDGEVACEGTLSFVIPPAGLLR
jgi:3-hydroxymyristoyl/3-hydroxydecanoyl-(acyl carrier protein) dehydratase